jgi:hypothetical protein
MSDRGQAHSLEGVAAALLVVLGLLFAVQVSVTGPLASNTAREAVSDQLDGAGGSALAVADERDALRGAALDWNASRPAFNGSATGGQFAGTYVDRAPPGEFGDVLRESFSARTVYNVDVVYHEGGNRSVRPMVYSGEPTDGAATVSRTVTLYDDDTVASGETLSELGGDGFYVADTAPNEHVYAVVRVEVTLWRA